MKTLFILLLLSVDASAQNLTPEEQKTLLEEVKTLKERVRVLEAEKNRSSPDTRGMMEALQKGRAYQEAQNKALEELDKDE